MRVNGPSPGEHVRLEDIDLFDPARFQRMSQHPAWHTLRAQAPVWRQETPGQVAFWSVTRYHDVVRMLKDVRRYSSRHGTILAVTAGDSAGSHTINLMDPPEHRYVRVPTIRTMSTEVTRRRAGIVADHVRRILQPCYDGEVDFAELMLRLPMAAIGEVLGIPLSYWPDIPGWTMAGVAPEDPVYTKGNSHDTLRRAHYDLFAMFAELIATRRRKPADDLISKLIGLDFGGTRLDDNQVLLNCYSFVMGASTTTPHTANQTLLALAERPATWERLRERAPLDLYTVDNAIEEGLRWSTPTNHLMRRTTARVEIAGTEIAEGELVCAWVASANRDASVFKEPYVFDPWRSPNPHIAFGIGPHYCIGGPAARVALNVLLAQLLADFEGFEVTGEVTHLRSNFINGITRLPVRGVRAKAQVAASSVVRERADG